jgi:hypothetical protein
MHTSYCHACFPLLCMPLTIMHASYCYACFSLPCMPFTTMHVRTFRHWQLFFYTMSTVLFRCSFLPLSPTVVYLPLPYISHYRISLTAVYFPLPCMPFTAMHASYCYAYLPLPCMSLTIIHVSHCHACLLLPCMSKQSRHWQFFFCAVLLIYIP